MVSNAVELQKIICGLQMLQLAMWPLNVGVQTSEWKGTCCHSLDLDRGCDFFYINFETEKVKDYGYIHVFSKLAYPIRLNKINKLWLHNV
jgi:hypothetical protein